MSFFSILCKRKKELFKPSKHFFPQTVREPSDWEDVDMQGSTCVVAGDIPWPGGAVFRSQVSSRLVELQFIAASISLSISSSAFLGGGESKLTEPLSTLRALSRQKQWNRLWRTIFLIDELLNQPNTGSSAAYDRNKSHSAFIHLYVWLLALIVMRLNTRLN